MAIRYAEGQSLHSTRNIAQAGKTAAVQRNSMKGMPGFINTKADASSGGLAKSKPVAPRFNMGESLATTRRTIAMKSQGAYIGKRAKPGGEHYSGKYADNGKFRGSSDKSYRATSMTAPGRLEPNTAPLRIEKGSEKEGPKRGQPTRGAKMGGVHSANRFSASGAGHPGRMEKLRGRARMSTER
jgi:hypothetical protein